MHAVHRTIVAQETLFKGSESKGLVPDPILTQHDRLTTRHSQDRELFHRTFNCVQP